jgi:hypothetical protein
MTKFFSEYYLSLAYQLFISLLNQFKYLTDNLIFDLQYT